MYRATGLLAEAITVSRSAWLAAWTFVTEGARHILEGYDHVLFVICLIIGATTSAGLLWRVTGFTLGHSITLAMGFLAGCQPLHGLFPPLKRVSPYQLFTPPQWRWRSVKATHRLQ